MEDNNNNEFIDIDNFNPDNYIKESPLLYHVYNDIK